MSAARLRGGKESKRFTAAHQTSTQTDKRTLRASLRLPQSKSYNQSGLDIENPSAKNMISLEKLLIAEWKKKKKCFANIIQIAPFVMDLTNHRDPTHYQADLGQTFAYSIALNALLGTSYWMALITHSCLSWQSRKLAVLPTGLTSSKRYSIVPKWHINDSASFQMSCYGGPLCHELPWQIIAFGIQFNKGTNLERMAD